MTRHTTLRAVLLCAAVCAAYGNALDGAFQYDDDHSLVRNPAVRDLANVPRFFLDPSLFSGDADKAMYRPLLLTTYALNHAVHGYAVGGYHVVNIALHLACALLLWRLAALLEVGPAWWAALLFAVHPLASEPVNYISSRSELLLAACFLAAVVVHVEAARRGSARLRWAAVALCALALLSKATAVALAPVLLVLDLTARRRAGEGVRSLARRHGPYWIATGLYLAVIIGNGFLGGSLSAPVRGPRAQLLTQLKAPAYYARLLAVPHPLSVEHPFSEATAATGAVVLGAALVASLAWVGWRARRPAPRAAFAAAAAALVLLPTSLMPLNLLVNERRLYLVLAAATLGLAVLGRVRAGAAAAAAVALLLLTAQRNPAWAAPTRLWESARTAGSRSYRTWANLGKAYQDEGRPQEARAAYAAALAVDDRHGDVYNNIAVLLHRGGQPAEAIPWYEQALARAPAMEEIHRNLADAYTQLHEPQRAAAAYRRALELDSANGGAWSNYGELLMAARQVDAAEAAFRCAIDLAPGSYEPRNNLGNALSAQGRDREAVVAYREALALVVEPETRAAVLTNLGESLRVLHALDEAAAVLDSALALAPTASAPTARGQVARTLDYRGRVALESGDRGAAADLWRRCLRLDSTRGSAWTGLGEVALAEGDTAASVDAFQRAVAAGGGARARQGLARAQRVGGAGP